MGVAEEGIISSFNTCPPLLSPGSRCQHCILEHWYRRTQSPQSGRPTAGIPFRHDPSPVYIAVHQWTEITPVPLNTAPTLNPLPLSSPIVPNFRRMQCLYWCLPYTENKTEKQKTKSRNQQENTRPAPPPPLYFTLLRSVPPLSLFSFNSEVDLCL